MEFMNTGSYRPATTIGDVFFVINSNWNSRCVSYFLPTVGLVVAYGLADVGRFMADIGLLKGLAATPVDK